MLGAAAVAGDAQEAVLEPPAGQEVLEIARDVRGQGRTLRRELCLEGGVVLLLWCAGYLVWTVLAATAHPVPAPFSCIALLGLLPATAVFLAVTAVAAPRDPARRLSRPTAKARAIGGAALSGGGRTASDSARPGAAPRSRRSPRPR